MIEMELLVRYFFACSRSPLLLNVTEINPLTVSTGEGVRRKNHHPANPPPMISIAMIIAISPELPCLTRANAS